MGRPKGSKNGVHKGRGRPKGSKNGVRSPVRIVEPVEWKPQERKNLFDVPTPIEPPRQHIGGGLLWALLALTLICAVLIAGAVMLERGETGKLAREQQVLALNINHIGERVANVESQVASWNSTVQVEFTNAQLNRVSDFVIAKTHNYGAYCVVFPGETPEYVTLVCRENPK
jgi:hypothetical protein